jgi:hypothetical protein
LRKLVWLLLHANAVTKLVSCMFANAFDDVEIALARCNTPETSDLQLFAHYQIEGFVVLRAGYLIKGYPQSSSGAGSEGQNAHHAT